MKRRTNVFVSLACALALTGAVAAFEPAAVQDDSVVQQKIEEFMAWRQQNPDKARDIPALREKVEALFADVDISTLGPQQLQMLRPYSTISPTLQTKVNERMQALRDDPGAAGAAVRAMEIQNAMRGGPEALRAAFVETVTHPGFEEALEQGLAGEVFQVIAYLPEETFLELKDQIVGLADHFSADLPPETLAGGANYVAALRKMDEHVDKAVVERARKTVLAALKEQKTELEGDPGQARMAEYFANVISLLEGAYMRGELIDHPAPEMTFTWSQGADTSLASLEDLKGKVVVLDFWATWCGPCIASFPNITELQKRYEGYDVAIVGVTSLQGAHYPGAGQAPIQTEGDPEREYELMSEFIDQKDITWIIAFGEENVFNPDFGVQGIPHMAIVDAEGKVRHNGLHPAGVSLAEKAQKIDALLKEAGLRTPPPVDQEGGVGG